MREELERSLAASENQHQLALEAVKRDAESQMKEANKVKAGGNTGQLQGVKGK